ncbi:MAG: SPOR domain-containing protein [Chromatiales bacterium]
MSVRIVAVLFGMLISAGVIAAPAAIVRSLQMPAWLEQGGQRLPLQAGQQLGSGDRLVTGAGGRLCAVDPEDLRRWAAETELQDGGGAVSGDGLWRVHLASFRSPDAAARLLDEIRAAGYAAYAESVRVGGRTWTRLTLGGFVTRADAEAAKRQLKAYFALPAPWVAFDR